MGRIINRLPNKDNIMMMTSVLVILAEVGCLFLAFWFLYWLLGQIFQQLGKVHWLGQKKDNLHKLRRHIRGLLIFLWAILSLGAIAFNGWLLYRRENLEQYTLELVGAIPSQFWLQLATGLFKTFAVLILVGYLISPLRRLLRQGQEWIKKWEQITANEEEIEGFFNFLDMHFTNSIWLLAILLCTGFWQLPEVVANYLYIALKIYLIVLGGLLLLKATSTIVDLIDILREKYVRAENILRFYNRLKHLIPFLQRCLEYLIYVIIATLVVQQIESIAQLDAIGTKTIKIITILLISHISIEIGKILVEEVLLRNLNLTGVQRQKRLTIIPLIQSFLKYFIYFGCGIWILDIFGIDPAPILAAAGILGLAVGLGAQNLINDIVCGFFILFENYYLVGDYIEMEDTIGVVEAIELRTTRIRHPNGQVYIIRNGEIAKIINYSKEYIYAVVDVGVAYGSDLDLVYSTLEEVGIQLHKKYQEVIKPTEIKGVEEFAADSILIRTLTKLKPDNKPSGVHNYIKRILRKMIKEAFEKEGIQIPFPQRVITFAQYPDDGKD